MKIMRLIKHVLRNNYRLTYLQCKYLTTTAQLNSDKPGQTKVPIDLANFPPSHIRNFCVIAHIDHGKSTFSDRLLEMAGLINKDDKTPQYLDKLEVERERGITVKAQTASLVFNHNNEPYLLNLIDTPGHVDFSFEVYRSLPACQGAILLVDATKGVQAQTIAHFNQALLNNVNIIPAINKIDLKEAKVKLVAEQLANLFSFNTDEIYKISAKTGIGCEEIITAIIEKIPPPDTDRTKPLSGLYFDCWSNKAHGVISLVTILNGQVKTGDQIQTISGSKSYRVREVGIFYPEETPTNVLYAGQVGYLSANVKNNEDAKVGDAFLLSTDLEKLTQNKKELQAIEDQLPKLPKPRPMVFAGIFPTSPSHVQDLRSALEKLVVNDASIAMETDSSPALGLGWRLGFLGLLHMDVFSQRLEQEYDAPTVVTAPSVSYKVKIKGAKNIKKYGAEILQVKNPLHLPPENIIEKFEEPMIIGTVITPYQYLGPITELARTRRGIQLDSAHVDQERILLRFKLPLNEVIVDFYDILKGMTSGYASFDYEEADYEEAPIVKLEFLINSKPVEELTTLAHKTRAYFYARSICKKLKEHLPPQQYKVAIQGAVGAKIVARETIDALKKDVTAKLYGGDITRAYKLLERQREGKAQLRLLGNIQVERDTFIKILSSQ